MSSPKPLIARIRARLVTMVWLLAFVVLAKGSLAALCIVDGAAPAAESAQTVQVAFAAEPTAAHADGDDAACWHAGSGGCHCTCVHAAAIPAVALDWPTAPASSARISELPSAPHPILIAPALRPPIA